MSHISYSFILISRFLISWKLVHSCPSSRWKKEWASSHTPGSNTAWECCIQRMSIPSISVWQSGRKPVSSELHKIILAKVQKGYKLLLKQIKSAFPAKISTHYVLHNYKVSRNSFTSKYKRGVIPRKKMESKFPVDMHIYMVCPSQLQSFTKFCWAVSEELRWQTVSVRRGHKTVI